VHGARLDVGFLLACILASVTNCIAGYTSATTAIVATVVDRLSRQYPRMTFHVMVSGAMTSLLSELRERNLDLAILRMAGPIPERT